MRSPLTLFSITSGSVISRDSGDGHGDDDDDNINIVPEIRDVADEELLQDDDEACLEPELETTVELFEGILALKLQPVIEKEKAGKNSTICKGSTSKDKQNLNSEQSNLLLEHESSRLLIHNGCTQLKHFGITEGTTSPPLHLHRTVSILLRSVPSH